MKKPSSDSKKAGVHCARAFFSSLKTRVSCRNWHLVTHRVTVAGLHRASPSTSLDKKKSYEILKQKNKKTFSDKKKVCVHINQTRFLSVKTPVLQELAPGHAPRDGCRASLGQSLRRSG
jgi:hypothetical protein